MSLSDCPPSFKLVKLGNPDAERDALNAGIQAMLRCMGANSLPDPTGHAGEYLTTDGSTFSWAPTTGNDRPIVIKKDFQGVTAGDELFYYAVSPLVLNGVSILGNAVGDLVVDVRKVPFGSFPATGGDSICAAAKPTLASAQTLLSTALTGWDKGVLAGDTLTLHVDSATTVTDFEITLYGTESYLPLSYTGALTDAPLGGPVGGSITLSGGDGTYTVDALPVSGTRPAGNGLALVGPVYSDSSGVTTTLGSYSWTDRFRSGDGQTLDVPSSVEVSVAGDPYWSDVSALLHCNGTNGSSTVTDETGKTWTPANSAAISTSQSVLGGASLYLPNGVPYGNNYVTTPSDADFSLGSGDFTIELWARYTPNGNGYKGLVVCDGIGATRGWLLFLQDVTGTLDAPGFAVWIGATAYSINLGTALTVGTWTNIVVVRDGGTLRMYINGVQQGTKAISGTVNDAAQPCVIGTLWGSGVPAYATALYGYIDEVRVTKGVCRYPSGTTFTPQALEWPNS